MSDTAVSVITQDMGKTYPYRLHEQGAALIVVLLVLILVLIAGAIAIRQSNQDIKVATSDQINSLLLQGSDGANVKLEQLVNGDPDGAPYQAAIQGNGIFGHFMLNQTDAAKDELIYCYNPRQQQYLTKQATIRRNGGELNGITIGYCDPSNGDDYLSSRQTVVTQVSITPNAANTSTESFGNMPIGRSVTNAAIKKYRFDTRATAALPSYNDPGSCFVNSSITGSTNTVVSCLVNAQVPSKQVYQQIDLEYKSNATQCIPFGKGTGSYSDTSKCTLKAATTATP